MNKKDERELEAHRKELRRLGVPEHDIERLFKFAADVGNYESRVVGRNDYPWGMISTANISDGVKPYETAISHGNYNNGEITIVENYDTKEEAAAGHVRWVARMTVPPLPSALVDCGNSYIQQMIDAIEDDKS